MPARAILILLALPLSAQWYEFGGELRARFEGLRGIRFRRENHDAYLMPRARLSLRLLPAPWLKLFAQAQDARVVFNSRVASAPPLRDTLDLRQAYLELGDFDKAPVMLRAGRQELQYGEERLLGAANWGNAARVFDAVRLSLHKGAKRIDAFSASVVQARGDAWNQHVDGDNLHGLWAQLPGGPAKSKLEPFFFWRLRSRSLDHKTLGLRWQGPLTSTLEGATEMAVQTGRNHRAWAGHWRAVRSLPFRFSQKLRADYNYAGGGPRGTFDILYPTPHDKYGLADQVGWRNIHHAGVSYELQPRKTLTLQAKYHRSWLADPRDGLYSAVGNLLARDPSGASGRDVGQEADGQFIWNPARHWRLNGGAGYLFPGRFLKQAAPGQGYLFSYLSATLTY